MRTLLVAIALLLAAGLRGVEAQTEAFAASERMQKNHSAERSGSPAEGVSTVDI
jgi:hypothetical protein